MPGEELRRIDVSAQVPSATEFLEFAKRTNVINLDVSLGSVLENADLVLRGRPGYVVFNIRCGLLIVDRTLEQVGLPGGG